MLVQDGFQGSHLSRAKQGVPIRLFNGIYGIFKTEDVQVVMASSALSTEGRDGGRRIVEELHIAISALLSPGNLTLMSSPAL